MTGEEVHAQKSAFLRLFAKKSCRIRQNGFDALRKHVINKQKPILLKLALVIQNFNFYFYERDKII